MDVDPESSIAIQIVLIVVLTLINAYFAASEMAIVSVNKSKIHRLSEEGNKKAKLVSFCSCRGCGSRGLICWEGNLKRNSSFCFGTDMWNGVKKDEWKAAASRRSTGRLWRAFPDEPGKYGVRLSGRGYKGKALQPAGRRSE